MDRQLTSKEISTQKSRKRTVYLIVAGLVVVAIFAMRSFLTTSVLRERLLTAKVLRGDVVSTLTASGVIVPEFEQKMTVPVQAVIEKVVLSAGEKVAKGQSIVQLNTEFEQLTLQRISDQYQIKKAQYEQQKLGLEKEINDFKTRTRIKELQLDRLATERKAQHQLLALGGTAAEDVKKAETDHEIAALELDQLRFDLRNRQAQMEAQTQEWKLDLSILLRNLQEQQRKLEQAQVASSFDGVVTWVNNSLGSTIAAGAEVARVADLSTFKVRGTIADDYAASLKTGSLVKVVAAEQEFAGTVSSVEPSAANGTVVFYVQLQNPSAAAFRPDMYVDVYLVTNRKANTLYLKNGAVFTGRKQENLFVIEGNKARKIEVAIGLRNYEKVEILNGLKEGDEVIISSTSTFEHASEVVIE